MSHPVFLSPAEPVVYFGRQTLEVDESAGDLEVLVWRAGTDLSRPAQVTVRSRPDPRHAHSAQGKKSCPITNNANSALIVPTH